MTPPKIKRPRLEEHSRTADPPQFSFTVVCVFADTFGRTVAWVNAVSADSAIEKARRHYVKKYGAEVLVAGVFSGRWVPQDTGDDARF
jgi:hypothetical protein